ncbi:MAG: redoxin domain-containing protein [Burkholderiales bacterium]|nr:redoxin domain-containing protein [Burkholderiales bacterium]
MTKMSPQRWIAATLLGAAALFAAPAQAQMPKPGDRAPAFAVMSTTGKPVGLADYLGKKNVVLFFYIAAFTDT